MQLQPQRHPLPADVDHAADLDVVGVDGGSAGVSVARDAGGAGGAGSAEGAGGEVDAVDAARAAALSVPRAASLPSHSFPSAVPCGLPGHPPD